MIKRETFPKVLLLLAGLVFFSANTVYFLDDQTGSVFASVDQGYYFDFDSIPKKKPYLNVKAAMLINYENGQVLYAKNVDQVRPIASITKLVTAMVILDKKLDMSQLQTITREDSRRSSKSRLRTGYELTLEDLLYAALMQSDNRSARALARAASGSIEAFVSDMNVKVKQLGLKNTIFFEPTGLDERNVSTAHEVAKIVQYAYEYDLIRKITTTRRRTVKVTNKKNFHRKLGNTNRFLISPYKVLAGKTGYIIEADYCLTTMLENKEGERLTLVILGTPGDRLRFREARRLADWGFKKI